MSLDEEARKASVEALSVVGPVLRTALDLQIDPIAALTDVLNAADQPAEIDREESIDAAREILLRRVKRGAGELGEARPSDEGAPERLSELALAWLLDRSVLDAARRMADAERDEPLELPPWGRHWRANTLVQCLTEGINEASLSEHNAALRHTLGMVDAQPRRALRALATVRFAQLCRPQSEQVDDAEEELAGKVRALFARCFEPMAAPALTVLPRRRRRLRTLAWFALLVLAVAAPGVTWLVQDARVQAAVDAVRQAADRAEHAAQ